MGVIMKIIDIHSHLLPEVDDGSPSMERSLQILQDEIREGVTDIICTPHYRLDWFHTEYEKIKEVFDAFSAETKKMSLPVNLYLGQELHIHEDMLSHLQNGKATTLNKSKYVLLELDWQSRPENLAEIVKSYVDNGYFPIIVHYERFTYKNINEVKLLRDLGALFQINAYSLFAVESEQNKEFAFEMLDREYVDFIASDYHARKQLKIAEAVELIENRYGKETTDKLFYTNAKKIIE